VWNIYRATVALQQVYNVFLLLCDVQLTPTSSKRSPGYRLLTARHVTRPQSQFRDKIDNSDRPFVPKITFKPNALQPLAGIDGHFLSDFFFQKSVLLTLPYLTLPTPSGAVQRSDHQVGPLRIPAKPKAKETSQKL